MKSCDQTCSHCAREFWKFLRARMAQMSVPRTKKGETTSFAEAAATSIKADFSH